MLSPAHAAVVDEYLADLRDAVAEVRHGASLETAVDRSYGS